MAVGASLKSIPSVISVSRVALAAGFVVTHSPNVRVALIAAAAITDVLDGWLARKANWVTRAGALIDPFADRVFVLAAVSTFLFTGALSVTGYFIMISRDLMTAVGFLVARAVTWLRPVKFKARAAGKVVTSLQLLALVALIRFPPFASRFLWLVGLASIYAIVDYTWALWEARAQ